MHLNIHENAQHIQKCLQLAIVLRSVRKNQATSTLHLALKVQHVNTFWLQLLPLAQPFKNQRIEGPSIGKQIGHK